MPAKASIQAVPALPVIKLLGLIDCSYIAVNSSGIIDIPWEFGGGFDEKTEPIGFIRLMRT